MPDDPTPTPQPPTSNGTAYERSDVGCMIGLAMILIFLPVSLYVAAPIAVLGIAAAAAAWGLMRLTPKPLRTRIGVYPVFWFWFAVLILFEISVAVFIKYADSDAFSPAPIQRM